MGVFCRDLSELYEARRAGRTPSLPELPLTYRDFALWQRRHLQGERLDEEIAYWRAQLAGAPTVLQLPADRPRPPRLTYEGASHQVSLPAEVAEDVVRLSRDNDATPYMLLLSVFGVLLYRLTGADDILVGGPFANRGRAELDQLVGFFANTLVLRIRLAGNPAFRTLLARVRETTLEALDHEDVPFEHVVEAVKPQRDAGVNPLVQVNFRATVGPPVKPELGGTTTSTVPVDAGFAAFDLALELYVREQGIAGELIYNTALFEPSTVERLAADFERLLRQVLADPDTRLLALELPGETEASTPDAPARGAPIRRFREASGSGVGTVAGEAGSAGDG